MIKFLHTFQPEAILATIGPVTIYWYGFFMMSAILAGLLFIIYLAKKYKIESNIIIDLAFWLILFGIIGARLYELIIDFTYYQNNPLAIFKLWQGGLAIHGAIIAGLITLYLFTKKTAKILNEKHNQTFWKLTAIITPGLALGQFIGRWGNYFNQELFGLPSSAPWAIPINIINRPIAYISDQYFHPTFLYESIGNLFIFIILFSIHLYVINKKRFSTAIFIKITALYLFLYSILRFSLEFLRLDPTLVLGLMRWPQIISIIIIIVSIYLFIYSFRVNKQENKTIDQNS
ncbi:MAG: prolipoprotein diacylglyceryl transferase [Parcubacteria group bacterium]